MHRTAHTFQGCSLLYQRKDYHYENYFAYYNQYKNGIDIAFADNTLLFLSCAEAEKNLHTTPNSQRLIDNLAIDNPLMYAALALDSELQALANAMDEDWSF